MPFHREENRRNNLKYFYESQKIVTTKLYRQLEREFDANVKNEIRPTRGFFFEGWEGDGYTSVPPSARSKKQSSAYTGRGYTYKLSCLPVTTGVPGFISWKYARRGICPGVESVVDVHVIYSRCNQAFPFFFLFQMWTVARSIIDSHYVWSNWKSQWARWAIISTSLKYTFFFSNLSILLSLTNRISIFAILGLRRIRVRLFQWNLMRDNLQIFSIFNILSVSWNKFLLKSISTLISKVWFIFVQWTFVALDN